MSSKFDIEPKPIEKIPSNLDIPKRLEPVKPSDKPKKVKVSFWEHAVYRVSKFFQWSNETLKRLESITSSFGSLKIILILAIVLVILLAVL